MAIPGEGRKQDRPSGWLLLDRASFPCSMPTR